MASSTARSFTSQLDKARSKAASLLGSRSDPWTDLGLTLPVFLGYHLGVGFMSMRNAADFVTAQLASLVDHSLLAYVGLTVLIGAGLVAALVLIGRGKKLNWKRFAAVMAEGAVYAFLMGWIASHAVGTLRLGAGAGHGFFSGLVMSLGAGFYEELAYRVVLFGLGARLIARVLKKHAAWATLAWAIATAAVFSAWHYFGEYGDSFSLGSFVFRWVCGLVFVAIYRYRGFAPVVWCHTLYDIWVLAL